MAVHLVDVGMCMMVSFCAVFSPRDVFDEIVDLIESVSDGLPTYSLRCCLCLDGKLIWAGFCNYSACVCMYNCRAGLYKVKE